jgi:hypothetical protein
MSRFFYENEVQQKKLKRFPGVLTYVGQLSTTRGTDKYEEYHNTLPI